MEVGYLYCNEDSQRYGIINNMDLWEEEGLHIKNIQREGYILLGYILFFKNFKNCVIFIHRIYQNKELKILKNYFNNIGIQTYKIEPDKSNTIEII